MNVANRPHPEGCNVSETSRLDNALRHLTLLHRQGECLSAASSTRAAHCGETVDAKDERKHLTLRTRLKRLARKTLSFSRSCVMHDLLIGLYMNQVEFDCAV